MGDQPEQKPAQNAAVEQSKAQAEPPKKGKELEIDGYKFFVDTDLLDDVEAFELIDQIENEKKVVKIVPLLKFLVGDEGYEDMKAHYIKTEGRFRISKLSEVYQVIVDDFDPKG
jgi:hypothetical protein